jgi:ribose 1,5-bisphosphokinase
MAGRLFVIVGPSGAGKDTLMSAAAKARPDLVLVRRVITRPTDAGGEAFEGVDETEFDARLARGAFALHWTAHGLRYGIPREIDTDLAAGRTVLFNGSRGVLKDALAAYPTMGVIQIVAAPEVLAARLALRGRETAADIAARLARADHAIPNGIAGRQVVNDGALGVAVAAFLAALQDDRG